MNRVYVIFLASVLMFLGGCAAPQAASEQVQVYNDPSDLNDPNDPLEPFNRIMWDFNYEILDAYVLRPTAVIYADYMPQIARTGLINLARNLEEPSNGVNHLLQGKLNGSFISFGRFMLNSTVGLLGLIDVASEIGLDRDVEEFGEVLGKYGLGTGPYLMMPARGPSDIRSSVGDIVDISYFPMNGLNLYFNLMRVGIKILEGRALLIQQEQQLNSSADPYAFVKNAYFQNLEFKVKDGLIEKSEEEEALEDDIDAFLDDL